MKAPVDERHKLPSTKIYDSLGYVLCKVDQCNFSVVRRSTLVEEVRIVGYPGLSQRLLIQAWLIVRFLPKLCSVEV